MPNRSGYKQIRSLRHAGKIWVPDADHDSCQRCNQRITSSYFGMKTNKHHCYQCGIIICDRCISDIKLDGVSRLAGSTKDYDTRSFVQICKTCGNNYKRFSRAPSPYRGTSSPYRGASSPYRGASSPYRGAPSPSRGTTTSSHLHVNAIYDSHSPFEIYSPLKAKIYHNSQSRTKAGFGRPIMEQEYELIDAKTGGAWFSYLHTCSAVMIWQDGSDEILLYHNPGTNFERIPTFVSGYIKKHRNPKAIILSALTYEIIRKEGKDIIYRPLKQFGLKPENIRLFSDARMMFSINHGELGISAP